ncbi:MAG: hypothetical protein IJR63_03030 [Synergistaceae bacterium]|nr:hypothetical protein [Synergistaceae bacterium]
MGIFKEYCCWRCGYKFTAFLGAGLSFPRLVFKRFEEMRTGRLGEEAKRFTEEHPDGWADCNKLLMRCVKCGEYDCRESLAMYVPKKSHAREFPERIWPKLARFMRILFGDPEKHCTKYADYRHKCKKCGGDMRTVSSRRIIRCPRCGFWMRRVDWGLWD